MAPSTKVVRRLLLTCAFISVLVTSGCGVTPASPQEIDQALQASLTATGTATPDSRTEYMGMSYRSYMAWELEVTLENRSSFPITFGKDLILVESDASGGTFDGVLVVTAAEGSVPRLEETGFEDMAAVRRASYYSLSNSEIRYAGGGTSFQRGNTVGITFSDSPDANAEAISFGGLEAGESRTMTDDLPVGAWVRDEHRASVRVVLPELIVERGNEPPARFRWVLYFAPPQADAEAWTVNRQEIVLLEPDRLEQMLIVPETNQVTRIFAANWLAEIDPDRAAGAMINVGRSLRDGDLLAVCLYHLARFGTEGLGEHAQKLLADVEVPNGIRRMAAEYLAATRFEPAFGTLTDAAVDEESSVAQAAISAIGSFPPPQASAALLELADGNAGRDHRDAIFGQLAHTRDPDALAYLAERSRRHDNEALNALVLEGAPESFDIFAELGRSKSFTADRDQLARGLARSGGDRACDILMDWLAEERLSDEGASTTTSTVVDELSKLSVAPLVPRLTELARNGHLPALQVLSRTEDPAAREPLQALARDVRGTARFLVLDGLADHWPEGNDELFKQALRDGEADLVPPATRALLQTDPDALPRLLLPLIASEDEMTRWHAASTLASCDPGDHADGYVDALLATSDEQIASELVSGLIDHGWSNDAAVPRLAHKLEQSAQDDFRYQVVRLLRHLSGDAMGPETIGDFWDQPDEWTSRWLDWAAEHATS